MVRWDFAPPTLKLERLERRYWLPISLSCVHIAFFAFYLQASPYFPISQGLDVVWHTQLTAAAIGSVVLPSEPLTEMGAHLLFAFSYSFLGAENLLTSLRTTAAVVEILSILVAYCLFQRIFRRYAQCGSATYATVAFSLILPSELIYYYYTGTYANMVGDFFVMLSLLAVLILWEEMSPSSAVTVVVVEGLALISHTSVMIFAAIMLGCSAIAFNFYGSKFRNYVLANLGFVTVPLAVLLIAPYFFRREINLIVVVNRYLAVQNNPAIALEAWFHNYVAYTGVVGFAIVLVAFILNLTTARRRFESFLLGAWFAVLFLGIFFGPVENNWRFVLLSFIPASGLVAQLLAKTQHGISLFARRRIQSARLRNACVRITIIGIILIIMVSGSFPRLVTETYLAERSTPQRQLMIYDSMAWLASNATSNAVVVSVGLSEYRYLSGIFNVTYAGDYELLVLNYPGNPYNPESLIALEGILHFNYVAVSVNYAGFRNYYACAALKLAFQNSQVAIFSVLGDSSAGNSAVSNLAVLAQEYPA
jgi:hypothetical protein